MSKRNTRKMTLGSGRANSRIGSDFEDFLREEGRLEEATAVAVKRVLARKFDMTAKVVANCDHLPSLSRPDSRKRSSRA